MRGMCARKGADLSVFSLLPSRAYSSRGQYLLSHLLSCPSITNYPPTHIQAARVLGHAAPPRAALWQHTHMRAHTDTHTQRHTHAHTHLQTPIHTHPIHSLGPRACCTTTSSTLAAHSLCLAGSLPRTRRPRTRHRRAQGQPHSPRPPRTPQHRQLRLLAVSRSARL